MLKEIALSQIFGLPLVVYGGIMTITLLIITALLGFLISKGKFHNLKMHVWLARITIVFALGHATLALSIFINLF
jgi:hypothetical protein